MRYRHRTRSAPRVSAARAPPPPAAIPTIGRVAGRLFRQRRPATTSPPAAAFGQTPAPKLGHHPVRVRMDCFLGPRRHAPPRRQHCNLAYPRTITGCGQHRKDRVWISCNVGVVANEWHLHVVGSRPYE
jgi:hypothetical protein